jgi:hypothetical protein
MIVCRRRLASDLVRASDEFRPKWLTRITLTGCPVLNCTGTKGPLLGFGGFYLLANGPYKAG